MSNSKGVSEMTYLMPKGTNTSWLLNHDELILASNSQLAVSPNESQDDKIPLLIETDIPISQVAIGTPEENMEFRKSDRTISKPLRYGFE